MTLAIGLLIFSIVGITGLFTLKNWEERSGRVLAPGLRAGADVRALEFKAFLFWCLRQLEETPSIALRIARILIHDLALAFAAFARWLERQARRLADMVSHKHRFERREPRNEFLKRVGEPKNGNGGGNPAGRV